MTLRGSRGPAQVHHQVAAGLRVQSELFAQDAQLVGQTVSGVRPGGFGPGEPFDLLGHGQHGPAQPVLRPLPVAQHPRRVVGILFRSGVRGPLLDEGQEVIES